MDIGKEIHIHPETYDDFTDDGLIQIALEDDDYIYLSVDEHDVVFFAIGDKLEFIEMNNACFIKPHIIR
jgi:hypothetical protein